MPLQDLERIKRQRNKKERGLPVATNVVNPKDLSRKNVPRVSQQGTGFQAREKREAAALLETSPEARQGIIGAGKQVADEFKELRPKTDVDLAEDAKTGIPSNVTILPPKEVDKAAGAQAPVAKFGLPTDRLPSFNELGGAIGSLFKYVGQLSKFNRARGLVPGVEVVDKAKGQGLAQKDIANILQKQLEAATLSGDKEKEVQISAELDKIIHPEKAARQSDIDAILNQ